MLPHDVGKDITPYVLMDTAAIEQIRAPLHRIKIVVRAMWVQKGQGAINLFPYIKNAFPDRRVLSLTGDALKASFPSIGQTLGKKMARKTGYTVLSSKLVRCSTTKNDTIPVNIQGRKFFLPVQEYKGHFWVQWSCAYKRKEKIEILLRWQSDHYVPLLQADSTEACKVFDFKVKKDVIFDGSDTFLDTKTGYLAIQQAVEQSIYAGFQSRQAYLLKVDVPFVCSLKYTIGDTVTFTKSTTEVIKGRISRLKSFCDCEHAKTTLWINFSKETVNLENIRNSLQHSVQGVAKNKEEKQDPGVPNTTHIEPEHLIKCVSVRNAACQQGKSMQNREFASKTDLVNVLKENLTEIYLDLHDLTNKQIFSRNYEIVKN
ncbi:MAG: hypothetical protein COY39_00275 [Alphaproteobacteria bacterium CG_4_10_14_0_8_um_filter_37_21]|nr:MAG: hypothetical protein COY39_00275 [Alphaproteobacteria bacterium CG_4_10_14_0_8_um_filter_37_21]